jgi:cell division protein FtsW
MDRWMAGTVLFLTLFGLAMVFSASALVSDRASGSFTGYLFKQGVATAIGLTALFAATRFDYRRLRRPVLVYGFLALCLPLLILVLATGHQRWLNLGGFSLQPSELARVALIIFLADLLARRGASLDSLSRLAPCLALLGLFCGLIYLQPDFGTPVMIVAVAFCLFFAAGVPMRLLALLGGGGAFLGAILVARAGYRMRRLLGFINPDEDPLGMNFQVNQSLLAVGAGGVSGTGLGESSQKLFYLPAAHTDFIFAVIGEELGFIGCTVLIAAFTFLLVRGLRTAGRAPDSFGTYLAAGLTLSLVLQAFVNMLVVLALLPTKGLPLPFVSYGGSSLVASLLSVGLVLNVSQHSS